MRRPAPAARPREDPQWRRPAAALELAADMLAPSAIRTWVAQATRAPSSHNTQPWRFVVDGERVLLRADRSRALPANDPGDRELTISCGAALRGLEAVAAADGQGTDTELLPDPDDPDLLAQVRFTDQPDGDHAGLAAHAAARRSTRDPFVDRGLPAGLAAELGALAAHHAGLWLRFVEGAERQELATLVEAGDRGQFADPRWRRELAGWMRSRRSGEGLHVPPVLGPVIRAVVRNLDLGKSTGSKDRKLVLDAPLVAVLGSERDEPHAWLETGRALQSMLLRAAAHDVQAGYLNQPCQLAPLRARLGVALELPGVPQLVLRLGHARPAQHPTSRRPVDAVLELADHDPRGA